MRISNLAALLIAVALIIGAIIVLDRGKVSTPASAAPELVGESAAPSSVATSAKVSNTYGREHMPRDAKAGKFERANEITTPDGFLNSLAPKGQAEPFTLSELIGKKVILVDFWTYSCINCQRTLPYLTSWWEKYKDKGLVIIGLHTPEFEFEKKYENVLAAVQKFGIKYPVVLDNDYSTWRGYRNQYWPRKYLIDIDGYIVYDHIGEGAYEETERQIQKALEERMDRLDEKGSVNVAVTKEEAVPRAGSPEIYFGASRNEFLANGERGRIGAQTFTLPNETQLNALYFGGEWSIQNEYAENKSARAVILFRYKAKEVYFVASSPKGVITKVYNDGVLQKGDGALDCRLKGYCLPAEASAQAGGGEDVSADGAVFIKEDRLYKLIQHAAVEEHVLRIEIESSGLKAFTFTFG